MLFTTISAEKIRAVSMFAELRVGQVMFVQTPQEESTKERINVFLAYSTDKALSRKTVVSCTPAHERSSRRNELLPTQVTTPALTKRAANDYIFILAVCKTMSDKLAMFTGQCLSPERHWKIFSLSVVIVSVPERLPEQMQEISSKTALTPSEVTDQGYVFEDFPQGKCNSSKATL
ncbi:hypothetical protein BTVI_79058 [Pitangus sulphuratus]|nr:hypothetical protein BTVI_79058 [Pitangus sulphuratus]